MTMPNFLMIGAAKSGTTSLYQYLKQHPQVFMSEPKEPFFFAMEGKKIDFHGVGDNAYAKREIINNLPDYQALFDDVTDEIAIGEASAFYLYSQDAPELIHHYLPHAKLIVVLRNPVDRAYSSYKHLVRDMREPATTFEEALSLEETRIQAGWYPIWHYTQAGFYYDALKRYYDLFSEENIRVYLSEDLRANTEAIAQSIFEFIGVDPNFTLTTTETYNKGYIPKNRALQSIRQFLLAPDNPIKDAVKPFLPKTLRKRMLHQVTDHIEQINVKHIPIDPATRQKLISVFADDIQKLGTLINRDLSHWLVLNKKNA